jgi:DNA modification methylase
MKIQWHAEKRKVKDLIPAAYNPRGMDEKEKRDLGASIDEYGAVIPAVVNTGKRKNVLIGGHQRRILYMEKGIEEIDVMVPSRELTEKEEKTLNLRLNKNTGHFDKDMLPEMGLELLMEVGFGDEELAQMWNDVDVIDDDFDEDKAIKETQVAKTKRGDIWKLGNHKLYVGELLDVDILENQCDVVFMETPKEKKTSDKWTEKISLLIDTATRQIKENAHIFTWTEPNMIGTMQTEMREYKVEPDGVCMWIRNAFEPKQMSAFNSAYVPCVHGTIGNPFVNREMSHITDVLNKEVSSGNQAKADILDIFDIWITRPDKDGKQGEKNRPVTLLERPLKRCSKPGDTILDLTAKTGTTMMACEQLGRKCVMVEENEFMATIIIQRWESHTGEKAKKI